MVYSILDTTVGNWSRLIRLSLMSFCVFWTFSFFFYWVCLSLAKGRAAHKSIVCENNRIQFDREPSTRKLRSDCITRFFFRPRMTNKRKRQQKNEQRQRVLGEPGEKTGREIAYAFTPLNCVSSNEYATRIQITRSRARRLTVSVIIICAFIYLSLVSVCSAQI